MSRRRLWFLVAAMLALVCSGGIFFLTWLTRIAPSYIASDCGCTRTFFSVHKEPFLLAAPFVLLAILAPLRGILRAIRVYQKTQKMQRRAAHQAFLSIAPAVRLFRSEIPDAFTAGILRPTTFVSTTGWRTLSPTARAALLQHEQTHREHHDPALKFFCLILRAAIGWIPGVHTLLSAEEEYLEYRADARAVRVVGAKAIREVANAFLGYAPYRRGIATASFVAFEDRAALSNRLFSLSERRTVSLRRALLSITFFLFTCILFARWASAQPGAQCIALRPVCVANLPTASRLPPSVSTPSSFPNP